MSEVNINYVLDGVCSAISSSFGDDHPVYTDTVEQGFNPGSFFVSVLTVTSKRGLYNRWIRTHNFSVQYMPSDDRNAKEECWTVAERLKQVLTYIEVNGQKAEGTDYNAEITDGFLTVTVTYKLTVYEEIQTADKMQTQTSDVAVHEGDENDAG